MSAESGARSLDFFTVDFNEDITAFHGQTVLDQAEYLNEAIRYILSLYSDPQRSYRDSLLPDPTSVVILGHSMGGVVARAMLVQPNYLSNSINTIITMSAPHSHPPVTFDAQTVQIYDEINSYWRHAYSQQWANDNPLWHVTLVSIAGGSLDTVVPSDYARVESLVPETHGFTVFTTSIPTVWTSMDHQAILWCDQFRKVVARALYDIVDAHRASQTKPRADRMRLLKRRFLPGIEAATERTLPLMEATTLLTLGDESSQMVAAGDRLVLHSLGGPSGPKAHLLPIQSLDASESKRFTLMTNASLYETRARRSLEILLCSVFPFQAASITSQFSTHIDLSGSNAALTRLACKNAASDASLLPSSALSTDDPFGFDQDKETHLFSYLQYRFEHLSEHQFIAIVDIAASLSQEFVVAEFTDQDKFQKRYEQTLPQLLAFGLSFDLPAGRPMAVDVNIPALTSALITFDVKISRTECQRQELFAPLMRQYLDKPYESKYFVNVEQASVSLHGVAPYVPPPLWSEGRTGLAFQFWSDPTCDTSLNVKLNVDLFGSLGKLYMRYRTILAAFPLLVVAIVLQKQFQVYDKTGTFISFAESLDLSLRQSLPLLLLSLTLLSMSFGSPLFLCLGRVWGDGRMKQLSLANYHRHELLIGTEGPVLSFLVLLIGAVCIGVCAFVHYLVVCLIYALSLLYGLAGGGPAIGSSGIDQQRRETPALASTVRGRKMISTVVLLFLVSTFIPYQFAFLVACLIQLFTTVRAFRIGTVTASSSTNNYYNYAHSILLLMIWVLPINIPILAVWVRNLTVHWLTPFSSHHNVLSIMSFILLVENMSAGRMIPQITSWLRHVTSVLLFGTALCAAIFGVSHAYFLHDLVNLVAAWLVVLHATSNFCTPMFLVALFGGTAREGRKRDEAP